MKLASFLLLLLSSQLAAAQVVYREPNFVEQTLERSRQQKEEFRQNDEAALQAYERSERNQAQTFSNDAMIARSLLELGDRDAKATPNGIVTLQRCLPILSVANDRYQSNDAESFKCHIAVNAIVNARQHADVAAAKDNDDLPLASAIRKANAGDAAAMDNIGYRYERGLTVPKDFGRALSWYRQGAQKNNCYSQNSVGRFHLNGWGVAVNYHEARRWFQLAADNGCQFAQGFIEQMRARGQM